MHWPASIVLIGAGKVASALGTRLRATGHQIKCVWSRNLTNAQTLANALGCTAIDDLTAVPKQANLYLILTPDHAIPATTHQLAAVISPSSLVMHTSGATPANALSIFQRHGVFYPLQTLSPGRKINFEQVPLCLHVSAAADFELVAALAQRLSKMVFKVSDEQRLQLHLAAVFVNNFTNYMQHIAQEIVQAHDLPGELLLPLLQETMSKLETLSPSNAQTGPALRSDSATLERHQQLLEEKPHWQVLYQLLSEGIKHDLGET